MPARLTGDISELRERHREISARIAAALSARAGIDAYVRNRETEQRALDTEIAALEQEVSS